MGEMIHGLYDHALNAVCCGRVVFEGGVPVDRLLLYANPAFQTHTGLSDVTGRLSSEVLPGIRERDRELEERLDRVALTGKPEIFELFVNTLQLWLSISAYSPLADHVVMVFDNITARKRQEKELEDYRQLLEDRVADQTRELRESEARYRGLFESLPVGVVVHSAEGPIIAANEAASRILRLSMEQIQGWRSLPVSQTPVREDGSPFPMDEHPALVTLSTGKGLRGVVMGLGDAQHRTWISINAEPFFREGEERPYAAVTSFVDMTERVKDGAVIRTLSRQYQAVLAAATDVAIFATDLEGTITLFNSGAELMLGYTEDEVVGSKTPALFAGPGELEATATELSQKTASRAGGISAVKAAVNRHGSFRRDWACVRRDGSEVHVTASITPTRTEEGETTGYLAVLQDITDRVRLEEVLRQSARVDQVTGLANRTVFNAAAEVEFKRVKRFKSSSALMMIDIDGFKRVNDTYGHDAGDRALAALGRVLKGTARATDLPARFGGDECLWFCLWEPIWPGLW